jgi:hypothetical protein
MLLPSKWLPLCCSLTTTQHAPYAAPANRGNTALHANRTASDFQRQCCCLASGSLYAARGSLYAAPMLLAVKLPAVNCRRITASRLCRLPFFLPAEPCLLTAPYIQLQSGHAFTAGSLAQSSRSPPGDS